jgi:hypothetical protein
LSDWVKVKVLKTVGHYVPGQVVEVTRDVSKHLADGKKAMLLEDYDKLEKLKRNPANLTVKEMIEMDMKNAPVNPDVETFAKAEQAAMNGKPVASGEPVVATGGITPPTQVYPAFAEKMGHDVTQPEDVKPKKSEAKNDAKKK